MPAVSDPAFVHSKKNLKAEVNKQLSKYSISASDSLAGVVSIDSIYNLQETTNLLSTVPQWDKCTVTGRWDAAPGAWLSSVSRCDANLGLTPPQANQAKFTSFPPLCNTSHPFHLHPICLKAWKSTLLPHAPILFFSFFQGPIKAIPRFE